MSLVFIPDNDKLAVKDIVVPVVLRAPGADLRGALVDIGGQYGALRQAGWSHADALTTCARVADAWVRNERIDLPIRHLGDESILEIARGAERIPTSDDGGLVDIGCQVRQRWQAGYDWARATKEAGDWIVQYYGGENPWGPQPAVVGHTSLQSITGQFVCVEPSGRVVADRPSAAEWETFAVLRLNDTQIALQTAHHKYLVGQADGSVVGDSAERGAWTFEIDGDTIRLKSAHNKYLVAIGGGGGAVRADRDAAAEWETFTASDLTWARTPGSGTSVVYPELVGRLRIENGIFVDDTGPVLPLFAHAGDLFALWKRDRDRANDQSRKVKAAGFHGTRTWSILGGGYWEGPDRHIAPKYFVNYYDLLREWLRDMHAARLRVMLSMGDIGQLGGMNERLDFARRLAQIAREVDGTGHIIAFLDGGNEAWQTGEPDPVRLAQFVREYRNAGGTALLTLTSPPGEEPDELNKYSIAPADCYDVHGYRDGRFFDKRRHIFSIPYEGKPNKRLGVQSEPPGSGDLVSVTSNKHELNDEAVATLGLQSLIARQVWVWFSGEGVRIQRGLETENGFAATPRICAVLPKDVMAFQTLHHSGNTWASLRIVDEGVSHESRVDGAQHVDGRCVYIFDGTPGSHTFRAARNFSGMLYHPGTGEGEPFSKRRGEVFTISWDRGRLFVGRIE